MHLKLMVRDCPVSCFMTCLTDDVQLTDATMLLSKGHLQLRVARDSLTLRVQLLQLGLLAHSMLVAVRCPTKGEPSLLARIPKKQLIILLVSSGK